MTGATVGPRFSLCRTPRQPSPPCHGKQKLNKLLPLSPNTTPLLRPSASAIGGRHLSLFACLGSARIQAADIGATRTPLMDQRRSIPGCVLRSCSNSVSSRRKLEPSIFPHLVSSQALEKGLCSEGVMYAGPLRPRPRSCCRCGRRASDS